MWEATFDAIHDPVMIIDKNFNIERANRASADRSGHDIKDLIDKKCYRVFAGRDGICPHCPLPETLKRRVRGAVEIKDLMPNGDFEVNSYPLLQDAGGGEGGGEDRVVHHYRDVTEERRLQRKLSQSEKMAAIGMLAGGVAHEINNPLAGILAFTQLLKGELPEGQSRSDIQEIEEAAKRCKKIVEELLVFAQPHREGDRTALSLEEAIEKILPLSRLNLRHRNVTMTAGYESNLPLVRGNAARLQQVFLNLINNAGQSMSSAGGGEVALRVRGSEDRGQVLAEVIDHGCGIRSEDLPKIFDPFFTTKGRTEGTGLGLSICYSIISEHGGKIEVESEVGKGSLFRVILPAIQGATKENERAAS
jgi:two-component system NtrC family sensor kinase